MSLVLRLVFNLIHQGTSPILQEQNGLSPIVVEVEIGEESPEKGWKKDKRLGRITLTSDSISAGEAKVFNFTGHSSHYWMSIGRGNYVAPQPPEPYPVPPKKIKEIWEEGGIFASVESASAAGERLLTTGIAKKIRIIYNLYGGWTLLYVPRD